MAEIRLSGVSIGEAYDVQAAFTVFHTASSPDVFEVRSPSYTIEQYVVAPALRPTGAVGVVAVDGVKVEYEVVEPYGVEMVSSNVWPVSGVTEVAAGPLYALPQVSVDIDCSARFVAGDDSIVGTGGTRWTAVSGDEKFELVSSSPPVVLGPDQYSRFDGRIFRWVDSDAVQFDGLGTMHGDGEFAIGSDKPSEQTVGVMMMTVLQNPSTDSPMVGFGLPGAGKASGVWVDPYQNIYLRDRYGVLGVLEYKLRWYGTPVCISLSVGPDASGKNWSAVMTVDSAGSEPSSGKWALPKERAVEFISGSLLLFPGDGEVSCEVLELLTWRKGFTFADLLGGYSVFQNLYGI